TLRRCTVVYGSLPAREVLPPTVRGGTLGRFAAQHLVVGAVESTGEIRARGQRGPPESDRDRGPRHDRVPVLARDGSAEPVTDVRGIVQFDPGQDHDELVSAVTCDEVVTAYRACQRGSHALQHEIPTEMSVDAVHGMEVVEVE